MSMPETQQTCDANAVIVGLWDVTFPLHPTYERQLPEHQRQVGRVADYVIRLTAVVIAIACTHATKRVE